VNRLPTLETARLLLSPLTGEDAGFILELLNEPALLRDIGDKGVRTRADAQAYLATGPLDSYRQHGFGLLRVSLKHSGEPIGICGLLKRDILELPDLGYALLERHWSNGYAIEAATAVMTDAQERLRLRRLCAITALENPSSIRILEKLGFRFVEIVALLGYDSQSRLFAWEL